MKAVGVTEFGGPEALQVVEIPDPHAGPGEIRLRVRAASVNPADVLVRTGAGGGTMGGPTPPHVPGMDAAGVVDEVGDGAPHRLRVGDRAMAVVLPSEGRGAYAEYVVVPAESVAAAPAGAGFAAAATLPMNGLTAWMALNMLDLQRGQTLLVTGAAGAVGGYAVQLARHEGIRVVADAASADEALVRELGADVVVPRGDDAAADALDAVPGGVDGVVDAALYGQAIVPAVRDGGGVALLRHTVDTVPERGIALHQVAVSRVARDSDALDHLRELAERGVLTLRVAQTFRPEQASEAHRLLAAGGIRGRLVIEF